MTMKACTVFRPFRAMTHMCSIDRFHMLTLSLCIFAGCSGDDGLGGTTPGDASVMDSSSTLDSTIQEDTTIADPMDSASVPDTNMDSSIVDMTTPPADQDLTEDMGSIADMAPPPEDVAVAAQDVNSAPTESAWNPMYAKPISIVLVLDYVKTECAGMDVWTITIVRQVALRPRHSNMYRTRPLYE